MFQSRRSSARNCFQCFKGQRSLINVKENPTTLSSPCLSCGRFFKTLLMYREPRTKRAICQWQTVSRSFVYINHRKFRIVRPFTRPSESTGLHLRASCEAGTAFATRSSFEFSSEGGEKCQEAL